MHIYAANMNQGIQVIKQKEKILTISPYNTFLMQKIICKSMELLHSCLMQYGALFNILFPFQGERVS